VVSRQYSDFERFTRRAFGSFAKDHEFLLPSRFRLEFPGGLVSSEASLLVEYGTLVPNAKMEVEKV
jgi:hypothetical protein